MRANEDDIGAFRTQARDTAGDDRGRYSAASVSRQREEVLDHANAVRAFHGRAIGAAFAADFGNEELRGAGFLLISVDEAGNHVDVERAVRSQAFAEIGFRELAEL